MILLNYIKSLPGKAKRALLALRQKVRASLRPPARFLRALACCTAYLVIIAFHLLIPIPLYMLCRLFNKLETGCLIPLAEASYRATKVLKTYFIVPPPNRDPRNIQPGINTSQKDTAL
jgi:hypothetical protein